MPVSHFQVPTSAVPSLIGAQGIKVADIKKTSGASVNFDTVSHNEVLTTALISGSDEQIKKAIEIIKISVLNARAADYKPAVASALANNATADQAEFDLRTFAAETANLAFSSWYNKPLNL